MRHITRLLLGSAAVYWSGAGGGQGAGGEGGGAGGGQQQQQQAPAFKAPDGMPAEYVGKDAGETLGKLFEGFKQVNTRADGLRGELARVPKAPDKPESYTFKPSEKLAPYFPAERLASDPILAAAKTVFHKANVPDSVFAPIIEGIYGEAIEKGLISTPFDAKAELASFAKHNGLDDKGATAAITEAVGFAKGLAGQLRVPDALKTEVEAALVVLADTAAGATALRAIRDRLGENGIRIPVEGAGGSPGAISDADLDKLTSDPRIDPANEFKQDPNVKYDPALRKRYDDGMTARGRAKYAGKQ